MIKVEKRLREIDKLGNRYMAKVEVAFYQKDWRNSKAQPNPKEGTYQECENN